MSQLLHYAFRSLYRSPRFTIPALLMLACGIALSSVCYAVLEVAVLKAIPYEGPERIVEVVKKRGGAGDAHWRLSRADFAVLRNRTRCFEALGYQQEIQGSMAAKSGNPSGITKSVISPGLLEALRLRPVLGRPFSIADFGPSSAGTAILSHALWSNEFSADAAVLGRHIGVDGKDFIVIGVMSGALHRPVSAADIWVPDQSPDDPAEAWKVGDKLAIARVAPRFSPADAQREIAALQPVSIPGHASSNADRFEVLSLADQLVGPARRILALLLGACLAIQLVACLNVGQLLLARRMRKARDLGIQLALGSNAARISLDMLCETLFLALGAGLIAIVLSLLLLPAAAAIAAVALGAEVHVSSMSGSVFVFGISLTITSSLVCAATPTVLLRKLEVTSLINKRWENGHLSFTASRLQELLIVAQVAAAVVLMSGFGLLAKSVYRLSNVSFGFNAGGLSYVVFDRGGLGFPASILKLHESLNRLSRLPSVESAAIGSTPMLTGARMSLGISARTDEGAWLRLPPIPIQSVSGGYFSTMGIPLLRGRTFDRHDTQGAPCAAIVNQSFSRLIWSSDNPIGKQIDLAAGSGSRACEVVGMAGDAREIAIAAPPEPELFFSDIQKPASANAVILIRTSGGHAVSLKALSQLVAAADPSRRLVFSTDVGALVASALSPSETRRRLLGILAFVALLLAAGGMYAAATYNLSERRREIGVRMAMGAGRADIARMVYRHYGRLAAIGGLIGTATGAALSRVFGSGLNLFETSGFDLQVFAIVPVACAIVVLASVAAPALRAMAVNPGQLLRDDAF
ncbi:MAG TPA: ABC transporter permease [Bryobacteraceae bacterium]|nr:ABC transporter permease [Bryobacteraceae bacterium]